MGFRDDLLPTLQSLRALPQSFGVRRYTVTIRTRTWSGSYPGEGTPTVSDIVLSPAPKVEIVSTHEVASSGGTYREGDLLISGITPAFSNANGSGGYSPLQLDPRASAQNTDVAVILTGDEGEMEAEPVKFMFDRSFSYSMVVRLVHGAVRG